MSFRLFVYYCAVSGAWAGFMGWLLGRFVPHMGTDRFPTILHESLVGMLLGLTVAMGLSFLDAMFNLSLRQLGKVLLRVVAAVLLGVFGGLFGGFVGGTLYSFLQGISDVIGAAAFVLGWTIVGIFIGASISWFEVFSSLMTKKDFDNTRRKFIKCVIGGAAGGVLGGIVALGFRWLAQRLTSHDNELHTELLWSPTALGFVAIGACIGLLVGLAQIILKEAWIKVEAGFRPGREMLIAKEKTSIGRAEGADIALFGDSGVEKTHAHIVRDGGRYYLEDLQSPGGTFVNDQKVTSRAPLKTGDLIRVGKSVLRFNERTQAPR